MAKIIDFKTGEILADLPTDMANDKRMSAYDFTDDEHELQFSVHAIAWDNLEAKIFLNEAQERYRQEVKKVG